jgi:integrase
MALLKHQNSTNWYFRFILNGKIHFGSTKTTNKSLATKIERSKYEKALKALEIGEKPTASVAVALNTFLESQEDTGEYRNIKTYVHKLLGSKRATKENKGETITIYGLNASKDFHEITNADIQKLIMARRKEGNADATILLELVQLSKAVRLLGKLGYAVPTSINLKELKQENGLKPSRHKLRYLTQDEERLLFIQLDPSTASNDELKTERGDMRDLVTILLDTGARYNEIAQLKWADIDLNEKTICLYRTKTNNQSILSMTARAFATLTARHDAKRADQVYIFEDSKKEGARKYAPKAFIDACKRAQIEGITLHSLRRTHASRLVQAGVSLLSVSQLLGHASSRTTEMHYAHLAPNQAAHDAVRVLDGLSIIKN